MTAPALRVLSLGAGVQSTTLALLAAETRRSGGDMTVDAAIFADTGWEPRAVYAHLDRLEVVLADAGIPLHRVSAGNLRDDALDPNHRFASMPLFVLGPPEEVEIVDEWAPCPEPDCGWDAFRMTTTHTSELDLSEEQVEELGGEGWVDDEAWVLVPAPAKCERCKGFGRIAIRSHIEVRRSKGMTRRQCTSEYKLKPIKAKVRELLGYPHPTPVPRGMFAEQWIGFSTDEIQRVRSRFDVQYARPRHPLLELGMSRTECERWLRSRGWTVAKSACIGCPFHGNRQWRDLRDNHPDEWADAVDFDQAIRRGHPSATAAGQDLLGSAFLHRSRVPLDEAPIDRRTYREQVEEGHDSLFDLFDDEGDPDGCSPFGCRSGVPEGGEAA